MEIKRTTEGSETWDKRGNCTAAEIKYLVFDAATKRAAIKAIIDAAPSAYGENNELPLKEVRFSGYTGENCIEIRAVYASENDTQAEEEEDEEATMSFECGSGTKHITTAITQKQVYRDGSTVSITPGDAGYGIGWNGKSGDDAEFAGVDVPTADMKETYVKRMRLSRITTDYKMMLHDFVGKVNSNAFKGYAKGQVMFLGASYQSKIKGQKVVSVTFNFRISPNESGATVSGVNIGNKEGWQYVWSRSKVKSDTSTTPPTPKVNTEAIYLAQVAEYADFNRLGI